MDFRQELDLLIEISIDIGNSIQGQKIPLDRNNIYYAEGLGEKIINHILSARHLSMGYSLTIGGNKFDHRIDIASITVITRAALEAYLAFHFVFVQNISEEERSFRMKCWRLAGLLERVGFKVSDPINIKFKEKESEQILILKEELENNSYFKGLSSTQRNSILKGGWRLNNSWSTLAVEAGYDKEYFDTLYKYLCGYAHSGFLSIIQIQQAKTIKEQQDQINPLLNTLLMLLAKYMYDYIEIQSLLQPVKENKPKYNKIVFWKKMGNYFKG